MGGKILKSYVRQLKSWFRNFSSTWLYSVTLSICTGDSSFRERGESCLIVNNAPYWKISPANGPDQFTTGPLPWRIFITLTSGFSMALHLHRSIRFRRRRWCAPCAPIKNLGEFVLPLNPPLVTVIWSRSFCSVFSGLFRVFFAFLSCKAVYCFPLVKFSGACEGRAQQSLGE